MKKHIVTGLAVISSAVVVSSLVFVVAAFADTTGTGTTGTGTTGTGTTGTGTTGTGTTGTGTTGTGTTGTGTTGTGTTGTGTNCTTATGVKIDHIAIQQAFLIEMTRLITEKGTAYTAALSLSGSARTDAIKAANTKFRTGVKAAIKIRELAKQKNKSEFFGHKLKCKKIEKEDRDDDKRHNEKDDDSKNIEKKEIKSQIKDIKKTTKEFKKIQLSNRGHR